MMAIWVAMVVSLIWFKMVNFIFWLEFRKPNENVLYDDVELLRAKSTFRQILLDKGDCEKCDVYMPPLFVNTKEGQIITGAMIIMDKNGKQFKAVKKHCRKRFGKYNQIYSFEFDFGSYRFEIDYKTLKIKIKGVARYGSY